MKRETLFLKSAVVLMGVPILILSIFGLTWLIDNPANPEYGHILYPILIGMYASTIPFFIALYQAFRILTYIDIKEAFSELSVNALQRIKFCAMTISALYVLMLPFVFLLAELDDAPGLILFGSVPVFASMVIAVFAAVLQKLLKNAIEIKNDNELTI